VLNALANAALAEKKSSSIEPKPAANRLIASADNDADIQSLLIFQIFGGQRHEDLRFCSRFRSYRSTGCSNNRSVDVHGTRESDRE
jgi:hypothetical protein